MPRLNTTVHVYDEGETIVYLPGQEVLPQHREQITAPGVWEDDPDTVEHTQADAEADGENDGSDDASGSDEDASGDDEGSGESTDETGEESGDESEPLEIPAKAGPGSTTAAWADYAAKATAARELNIEIPADAGRDDIIEALNDAGIPTE